MTIWQTLASRASGAATSKTIGNLLLSLVTIVVAGAFLYSTFEQERRQTEQERRLAEQERRVMPEFMLAQLSLPCSPTDFGKFPELAVVISGDDPDTIAQVKKRLTGIEKIKLAQDPSTILDSLYELRKTNPAFYETTKAAENWIAYSVDKKSNPQYVPSIPVPIMFNKAHKMQLFAIGPEYFTPPDQSGETAFLAHVLQPRRLLQVIFNPDAPRSSVQKAQVDVTFLAENVCKSTK